MKKTKISILALLMITIITSIFLACTKETDLLNSTENSNLRESFLKNKDYVTIKSDFNLLNKKDKIELWNEKLNQLLKENLPIQTKNLIKNLVLELNKETVDSKKMSEIAISLANSIPQEDFYKMFTELNDYKYEGTFKGKTKVSQEIINDLYSINYEYKTDNSNIEHNKSSASRDCNCNWTCDLYAGGSTSNCKATSSGCGFLWAFSCEKRVGPI